MDKNEISHDQWLARTRRIFTYYNLGEVKQIRLTTRGANNLIYIINETYAIRFDGLDNFAESRFSAERQIYEQLASTRVPVPSVVVCDTSRTLAPCEYMIMTRIEGEAIIDSIDRLCEAERANLAVQVGEALATMHSLHFERFGQIRRLDRNSVETWTEYVLNVASRLIRRGLSQRTLPLTLAVRLHTALHDHRPLFSAITIPALVHWDAHFENLLQHQGQLTGVLDFEWALAGDPSVDFAVEDQWESAWPGSRAQIYAAYAALRPLDQHHPTRVILYKILRDLDALVESKDDPKETSDQYDRALLAVTAGLDTLGK